MSDARAASPGRDQSKAPKRTIEPARDENIDALGPLRPPAASQVKNRRAKPNLFVQTNTKLPLDVRERLEEIADIEGITLQAAVERAIMDYRT